MRKLPVVALWIVASLLSSAPARGDETQAQSAETIGFHPAHYDAQGRLAPWTSWIDAIDREMAWYKKVPLDGHGYPIFVSATFMGGDFAVFRKDTIPCTQNGMGILSYLKYWEFKGKSDAEILGIAKKMGDYLVRETLTADEGAYPRFTRSTGYYTDFPQRRSAQADARFGRNVIEPDKGGIAGYALVRLFDATGEQRYLDQAIRNADDLAKNMRPGDASHAPWPFRVDAVTGEHFGEHNGDMTYILRLLDVLIEKGNGQYQAVRNDLWTWIKKYQIAAPDDAARNLWIEFFEDYALENNRNSWSPLEMARYLIERKDALDPDWYTDAENLIHFAMKHFSSSEKGGVTLMGEQDDDTNPWGGACSKLGGVAAMFYAAGAPDTYKVIAYGNLTWASYFIDNDGCPSQRMARASFRRGGWQEDAHTDVLHNFMDAMKAVPEWGKHPPK